MPWRRRKPPYRFLKIMAAIVVVVVVAALAVEMLRNLAPKQ
jgi:hypothetical protein